MKIFKQILIVIGIILYANYIIHQPMSVDDYAHRETGIYSTQHMCRQSTIKRNIAEEVQHIPTFIFFIVPMRKDFIFAITNIFFAIVNAQVYHWQLARSNIDETSRFMVHRVSYNRREQNKRSECLLSGGLLWITRKRLCEC